MSLFSSVEITRPKLNKFDLSEVKNITFPYDSGQITPIMMKHVVPGDKFRVQPSVLMRFAPQLAPWYGQVDLFVRYYFIPYRLVWNEAEDWFTGSETGLVSPVMPFITMNNTNKAWFNDGTLADYLSLPSINQALTVTNNQNVSALPFRAYQLVFNEWFRNQNLVTEVPILKTSGDQNAVISDLCTLRKCMWEKDYFTSCLPTTQRGNPVALPVDSVVTYAATSTVKSTGGLALGNLDVRAGDELQAAGAGAYIGNARIENIQSVTSSSFTVNDLRLAEALQRWSELSMRVGSRYIEHVKGFFNKNSSDARLQRPEFLGGMKTPVVVSEVVSTFQDATSSPQGNLAGHGIAAGSASSVAREFEEHGMIMGLMYCRPRTMYQQGIPREFSWQTKYDTYYPQFAHLGEQAILNKELYYAPTGTDNNNATFGYQSRFAEYKYGINTCHGAFRSSLAYWGTQRIFSSAPALNSAFVSADPSNRIFAVTTAGSQNCWVTFYNKVDALRPMPYYGTPY